MLYVVKHASDTHKLYKLVRPLEIMRKARFGAHHALRLSSKLDQQLRVLAENRFQNNLSFTMRLALQRGLEALESDFEILAEVRGV